MPRRFRIPPATRAAIGTAVISRDRDALAQAIEGAVDWRQVPKIPRLLGVVLEAADDVFAPVLAGIILDAIEAADAAGE